MASYKVRRLGLIAVGFALAVASCVLAVNFMIGEKKIERHVSRLYGLADPQFARELGVLLGPPFLEGNLVTAQLNGDEIFPPMLAAIRQAKASVTFETYIYWSGDIGMAFATALSDAARRGVKCHVLLDWLGSVKMDEALIQQMTAAGVEVQRFHPPHWSHLARMNNRTHRKLLVVDGEIGFTGGVGIAPEWTGHAQDASHWRDTHFKVAGPVVAQMQSVFLDNWIKVTGHVLHGSAYFPPLPARGGMAAQMFSSSPTGGSESMQMLYLFAITAAEASIDLSAAYFVPDALTHQALVAAMARGVKVRIIVPGEQIDSDAVRSASRANWEELLQAGAVIAEYQPTMFHCKVLIVDGLLTSVGSTNFDNRSFRLNDEATLNVLDAGFALEQRKVFEADLAMSKIVTFAAW